MSTTEIGDPRLQALFGTGAAQDGGVRPTVKLPRRGMSSVATVLGAVVMAVLLFAVLNARRIDQAQPDQGDPGAIPAVHFDTPPPLYIPPAPPPAVVPLPTEERRAVPPRVPAPARSAAPAQPQIVYAPQPMPQFAAPPAPVAPPRTSVGSALVIDSSATSGAEGIKAAGGVSPLAPSGQPLGRMRASVFANRSMTIPQGHLIPAVLETGFDSTKPGFARAVVSRDVRGFDGTTVLIPRGSRLIGEYRSDVAQGQKRVAIIWSRLMRPDGMTIALESPAVDTVGRGGVRASVNTHFFQRLGDALLQSTFEVGRLLAGRAVNDPVIVVSGNSATAATGQIVSATNYAPTLKVPAGRSISVFVAHDLDFSAADGSK